ncbi:MAG: hypothetical protein EXR73_12565 [Myxococcales bacterium]|nr:hypothetical protein [Myxococcales bacterium]
MRVLGVVLFLLGGVGVAWATLGTFSAPRPRDVAFALGALVALVIALAGLLLVFVPGFFG